MSWGGRLEHDPLFSVAIVGICLTSLVCIASTMGVTDSPVFWKQCTWILLGAVAFLLALRFDYAVVTELSNLAYLAIVVMLVWLLLFGREVAGARSWIDIGPLHLQPSEIAKPILALMIARHCAELDPGRAFTFRDFLLPLVIVSIPLALVAAQSDMGTALTYTPILGTAWVLGGISKRTMAVVAVSAALMAPVLWIGVLEPYQKERILTVTDPLRDPQGAGYQVIQSRIAVGSGGVLGKGLFSGTQSRLDFLPAHHTDFIFSVAAEETGFLGSIVVLGLYLLLLHRCLTAALLSRDRQGAYLSVCVMTVLGAHFILNLGMVLGLLPTIGIPLPLLSYGGSSMLATAFALGLVYNVRMRRYREPVA